MEKTSKFSIIRLIIYKKMLNQLKYDGVSHIFSHVFAKLTGFTSSQVRRDLMLVGYLGSPSQGYDVAELEESISQLIDDPDGLAIAVVGAGKLGTSLLENCYWRCQNLRILVGFDIDKKKIGKTDDGFTVYHIDKLESIIKKEKINIAAITCPLDNAQQMAERLVEAGVNSILNYSLMRLTLPENIYVEDMDMVLTLEKLSYFTRHKDLFQKKPRK